ncbi:MAG: hypothetical protein ACYDBY_06915 [Thermoanaerobaculia bacterium]
MNTALAATVVLFQLVSSHGSPAPAQMAGGLSWSAPKGWSVAPTASSMRVVTYRVAPAAGDAEGAEVAVFFFGPGQGGGTQANVDRWVRQFTPEKGSAAPGKPVALKGAAVPVTIVTAEGTYASGMPGGALTPKPGWALRGGIAEGPQGPVFFKMVGPKKTVLAATPAFDAFLKTLKKG